MTEKSPQLNSEIKVPEPADASEPFNNSKSEKKVDEPQLSNSSAKQPRHEADSYRSFWKRREEEDARRGEPDTLGQVIRTRRKFIADLSSSTALFIIGLVVIGIILGLVYLYYTGQLTATLNHFKNL